MDPSSYRNYHTHEIDSEEVYNVYFSAKADKMLLEEVLLFPMKSLFTFCKLGLIKGGTLVDLSTGATIFHLLPICTLFEDIIILELNECCLEDTKKWLHKEQGCFDWSHASKILAGWEGGSDNWEAKEDDLRSRIKLVIKSDFENENPSHPVILPKADCVISLCVMGHIAKDRDDYCQNLKKLSKMLKLGGYLLLIGALNASHFCVGEHKYQILNFNEEDIKKSLTDHGFSIEYKDVMERKIPNDVLGYEHIFFICAAKKQELRCP